VISKYVRYGYIALICTFHSLGRCVLRLNIVKEMGTFIRVQREFATHMDRS
jgi:hypothetical protein